ncbi:MAG: hypothetical protein U9Q85_04660, partial [Patescibacteria group bacterium]|nr:hypothetical protein [Patescibacteria group bacterium]
MNYLMKVLSYNPGLNYQNKFEAIVDLLTQKNNPSASYQIPIYNEKYFDNIKEIHCSQLLRAVQSGERLIREGYFKNGIFIKKEVFLNEVLFRKE